MDGMENSSRKQLLAGDRGIHEVLDGFDDAVLMTSSETSPGQVHGRPMRIAEVDEDGTLWFFTSIDSAKVREALLDSQAYVVCQSSSRQVILNGKIGVVIDRMRIDQLWGHQLETWFPEGKDDPTLGLLHFAPRAPIMLMMQ